MSLLFSLLLVSGNAQAQNSCTIPAPALRNFALSQTLQTCDDCTSGAVNMGFTINYFGTNHSNIFVNSNGNATFGGGFTGFTPSGLGSVSEAILAPFFGDVDLRGAGSITYDTTTLGGRPAFVINWNGVGYFSSATNRLNTFQMVLVSRADIAPGDFDVEFNYNQIQWETGDASGGNDGLGGASAVVGYSDGIVVSFLELTGSLVNGAFLDGNPNTGLVNDGTGAQCGRYLFEIRNGTPQVVLGFDKSFNPSTVNLGTTSRLRFNIDNTVNILDVANINFTDNLPAGMQVASPPNANTTCTGGTITAVPGSSTISYSGGSVTGSSTCRVGVNVVTASAGNFVNISGDLTSDVGNSGTATATLTVNSVVDIALSQTESVDPVVAGSGPNNLVYVLTAANNGSNNATGVRIGNNLTLPTGVSVSSVTPSRGSFAAGEWNLGNLNAGDSEALTIVLTVGAGAASGTNVISSQGTLNNVNEIDSNNANNTVNTSTSIAANVDLALSQTESIDPVLAGSGAGNLSYVLRVDNNGPVTATGIVINDVLSLPAGTSLLSSTPSLGSFNGSNWSIASLAPGGNATLTLVLTVGATTAPGNNVISNQATLTSVAQPDSNPANNSVTTATSVSAAVDIALSQTESIDPVVAGSGNGNLTYILRARNNGPSLATGIVVAEALTLPSGVSLNSATPSQGTFNANNWALGSLAPGAEETLTLVITATANAQSGTNVIASQANVSALNQTDTNAANDTVTTATSISRAVDLALSQSESIDPVLAGSGPGNLTYVLTVSNNGPSDATGVSISDNLTLPSGVSLDSATPSQGSFNAGVWSLGNLPASASETLTLVLTAAANTAAGTDVISSAASVSALNESDSNGANDSVTTATSVTSSIDLALSQTESIDPVIAGSGSGNLTYVLTVANNGPSNATGVNIADNLSLPTGVTLDSTTPSQGSFNAGTWNVGNLPSGGSETLTFILTVAANTVAGTDVISSAANVASANEPDSNGANDAVTTATSVESSIDLALSQTESIDPVAAGSGAGNLTY
ncbi:MAG: hypothetical protein MI750_07960, partial [Xanthomonadales bacterium]|nr:hypothetical protein [Xanthomonadales bacterium]